MSMNTNTTGYVCLPKNFRYTDRTLLKFGRSLLLKIICIRENDIAKPRGFSRWSDKQSPWSNLKYKAKSTIESN